MVDDHVFIHRIGHVVDQHGGEEARKAKALPRHLVDACAVAGTGENPGLRPCFFQKGAGQSAVVRVQMGDKKIERGQRHAQRMQGFPEGVSALGFVEPVVYKEAAPAPARIFFIRANQIGVEKTQRVLRQWYFNAKDIVADFFKNHETLHMKAFSAPVFPRRTCGFTSGVETHDRKLVKPWR